MDTTRKEIMEQNRHDDTHRKLKRKHDAARLPMTDRKSVSTRINVDPLLWGNETWQVLMTFCVFCKQKDMPILVSALKRLHVLLPCEKCRDHYKECLEGMPPDGNRIRTLEQVEQWLWTCRSKVNKNVGRAYVPYGVAHAKIRMYTPRTEILSVEMLRVMCDGMNVEQIPNLVAFGKDIASLLQSLYSELDMGSSLHNALEAYESRNNGLPKLRQCLDDCISSFRKKRGF